MTGEPRGSLGWMFVVIFAALPVTVLVCWGLQKLGLI